MIQNKFNQNKFNLIREKYSSKDRYLAKLSKEICGTCFHNLRLVLGYSVLYNIFKIQAPVYTISTLHN